MTSEVRQTGLAYLGRGALAVIVILLGSSRVSQAAPFDAAEHARHCACAQKCRQASCCCRPRPIEEATVPAKTEAKAPPAVPVSSPSIEFGPCYGALPCDDEGLPTSPTVRPIDKVALTGRDMLDPPGLAGLAAVPPPRRLPALLATRIDDPPERAACSS